MRKGDATRLRLEQLLVLLEQRGEVEEQLGGAALRRLELPERLLAFVDQNLRE